ncbi:MAG: kelch repeat-containing protein, partial [Salinimicrobium sp.]
HQALAQKIEGLVIDSATGEVLEGVNIYDPGRETGTVTDSEGKFKLKNVDAATLYRFSFIGYETKEYTPAELEKLNFLVKLRQTPENLSGIELKVQKLHKKLPYVKLQDLPKAIYSFAHVRLGNKLFITGGSETQEVDQALKLMEEYASVGFDEFLNALKRNPGMDWPEFNSQIFGYDLDNNQWETAPVKTIERTHHNAEAVDGKIYIFGGKTLSLNQRKEILPNEIEVFDPATGELLVDETNPHHAVNFASFTTDSLLFVAGGSTRKYRTTGRKDYSNQVHVYNPKTGYWKELGSMPEGKETTAIRVGEVVYFIGGYQEEPLDFVEQLDLKTGKWKRLGQLPSPIERPSLTAKNNVIYIFGEERIVAFNIVDGSLKEYKVDFDEVMPQMTVYGDNLYIFGGFILSNFELSPSANFYKISLSDFDKTEVNREKSL